MNKLLILLAVFLSVGMAHAQSPIPDGPLVKSLPERLHMRLEFRPQEPSDSSARRQAQTIEIDKIGSLQRITVEHSDAKREEFWLVDGFLYHREEKSEAILRVPSDSGAFPSYFQVAAKTFYGAEIVSPQNYRGEEKMENRGCFVYEAGSTRIWVDKETRYPLAVKSTDGFCVFQFGPPPGLLTPPAEFVKYAEERKAAALRRRERAATR